MTPEGIEESSDFLFGRRFVKLLDIISKTFSVFFRVALERLVRFVFLQSSMVLERSSVFSQEVLEGCSLIDFLMMSQEQPDQDFSVTQGHAWQL